MRRPPELDALNLAASAVIEASAGTGKTHLLEHLVLELLITGRARLEEILIVTFTERATAELVSRIRQKIDQAIASREPAEEVGWSLDHSARARLTEARQSFDLAKIATIHAFCQRILTEEPLATGRLLGQTQVDGRQAFGDAFRDVVRRTLAREEPHASYLQAFLSARGSLETLEDLLYQAASARGRWADTYDEAAVQDIAERLAALDLDSVAFDTALRALIDARSRSALTNRLRNVVAEARAALATRGWGRLLACFDSKANVEIFRYFETVSALPLSAPAARPFQELAQLAPDVVPPLDQAVAQMFLPLVEAHLRARKLAEGLYDYDDMIRAVDEGLAGPAGRGLIEKLRRRFRFALIDEAQDTEPAQWRIFRRIFLESEGPNPVVLIGDPKQAIYGFRGADVHTYVKAREEIRVRGGTFLALSRNHRSHPEVVAGINAILDHEAQPRYFSGQDITYQRPVSAAKPPLATGPGITLFTAETAVDGTNPVPVRVGLIKQAMRAAIAAEIHRLQGPGAPAAARCSLSEIHVLVRSNAEAREIARTLHEAQIPNVLFRPDDIFKSAEAEQVRALLQAIADPTDRVARLNAWLTPFFDVSLADLANLPEPPADHPLVARLMTWKTLADQRDYDVLWGRVLDDSGVARRLRLSPAGLRRLTNFRHLFDILHGQAAARPCSIGDLAALLGAMAAGHRRSAGGDEHQQRLETEGEAVRIMTVHAAKGLEADIVFLYGGLTAPRLWRGVHALHRNDERLTCVGKPRRRALVDLVEAERHEEDERLLYVAMTRARKHLYLPFFPVTEAGDPDGTGDRGDGGDFDPFSKITGEYRHVNQRLRALRTDPRWPDLFRSQEIPVAVSPVGEDASLTTALATWTPSGTTIDDDDESADTVAAGDEMAALRTRRRGFAITSYSRLSDAEGTHRPPPGERTLETVLDAVDDVEPTVSPADPDRTPDQPPDRTLDLAGAPARRALPGGIASGLFLHAILEKVNLATISPLEIWRERPEVQRLIDAEARRHDLDPVPHREEAARLVHAALTTRLPLPDGSELPGIARAARVRREVDFFFPLPSPPVVAVLEDRLVHERGFVRGALDVLFEHGDRIYFADWKSNVLPDFSPAALKAHVALHYELQVQIYTLASIRLLAINGRDDYERQFGGLVYLFLRGLGATGRNSGELGSGSPPGQQPVPYGIYVRRPAYAEVEEWTRQLAWRPVAGAGGGR